MFDIKGNFSPEIKANELNNLYTFLFSGVLPDSIEKGYDKINATILEDILFFDIETTGFSSKNTICYLIGMCYFEDGQFCYRQLFAENPSDEKNILNSFMEFVHNFKYLVHFNGDGFDIPYIMGRCEKLEINVDLSDIISIDLFKYVKKISAILKLDNYKQKTVEEFLGINRLDIYSGGDLIAVYKDYVKKTAIGTAAQQEFNLLLLHNHDDICALPELSVIFSYYFIFSNNICNYYSGMTINNAKDYEGNNIKEAVFVIKMPFEMPTECSCGKDPFYIKTSGKYFRLRARLFEGDLKYYFPNYKDYYYVENEERVIHKSVSGFIDKAYRKPASPDNCFIKKTGLFIPQLKESINPVFKNGLKDKLTYYELTDDYSKSSKTQIEYMLETIYQILS